MSVGETMGGVDNICIAKTGILTKNLLVVTDIFVEEKMNTLVSREIMSESTCRLLCLSIIHNTTANPKIIQ